MAGQSRPQATSHRTALYLVGLSIKWCASSWGQRPTFPPSGHESQCPRCHHTHSIEQRVLLNLVAYEIHPRITDYEILAKYLHFTHIIKDCNDRNSTLIPFVANVTEDLWPQFRVRSIWSRVKLSGYLWLAIHFAFLCIKCNLTYGHYVLYPR